MKQECWLCGKPATKSFEVINVLNAEKAREYHWNNYERSWIPPSKGQRAYCDKCFADVLSINADRMAKIRVLKAENMIERAIRILEKGKVDVYRYRAAIDKVCEQVRSKPEKFNSADEVAAAIVLIHKGHSIQMQYKVGNYRVDICLPQWKVLLEIDGVHHKRKVDAERDEKILSMLPQGWRIVRIPTAYLEENPSKLIEAINALFHKRAKEARHRDSLEIHK